MIYEIKPGFSLYCKTEMEKYRCESFWIKEPETIEWMNGFKSGGIFYDIGANIGIYSLFTATGNKKINCFAFEPMLYNYTRLIENINLNQVNNVVPFNIALGSATFVEKFYLNSTVIGSSGSQLYYPINEKGLEFPCCLQYDILTYALDDFIRTFYLPLPNYIKIDVDGHEPSIIDGMRQTLKQRELQTLLIEFNGRELIWDFIKDMKSYDFYLDERLNSLENHSRFRRERECITAENMIFVRR